MMSNIEIQILIQRQVKKNIESESGGRYPDPQYTRGTTLSGNLTRIHKSEMNAAMDPDPEALFEKKGSGFLF